MTFEELNRASIHNALDLFQHKWRSNEDASNQLLNEVSGVVSAISAKIEEFKAVW